MHFLGPMEVIVIGVILLLLFGRIFKGPGSGQFQQFRSPDIPSRGVPGKQGDAPPAIDGCTNCGASLSTEVEISPSGDYKCPYCNSWSNVNQ